MSVRSSDGSLADRHEQRPADRTERIERILEILHRAPATIAYLARCLHMGDGQVMLAKDLRMLAKRGDIILWKVCHVHQDQVVGMTRIRTVEILVARIKR